jgi:FkbM family methyltransferase
MRADKWLAECTARRRTPFGMTENFLHNLEELPASGTICLLGERGRNSRLTNLLRECRPDLPSPFSFDLPTATALPVCSFPDAVFIPDSLSSYDLILITSGKYRPLCDRLDDLGIGGYRILNPNFVHPFLQPGGATHLPKLAEAREIMHQEQDRHYYDLVISAITQKSDLRALYSALTELYGRMGRQYLDFIVPSAIRTVIEGGMEEGRNTVQFLGAFPDPVIHAFEPDAGVVAHSYFKPYLEHHPRVRISPLALWSGNDRLPFSTGQTGRSTLSTGNPPEKPLHPPCTVAATSIDQYVATHGIEKVDFIKMDIEGSETQALKGATGVIQAHRPQLAVCMYHRLEHYHEIPLFLAGCVEDYVFRVGHYSARYFFSETVLYGIPRELHGK